MNRLLARDGREVAVLLTGTRLVDDGITPAELERGQRVTELMKLAALHSTRLQARASTATETSGEPNACGSPPSKSCSATATSTASGSSRKPRS